MSKETLEKRRAVQKARLVSLLKKIPLFSDLPPSRLRKVLSICSKETLDEGEILCSKGDESNEMYILLMGQLAVKIDDSTPIAIINPVNCIGEMGVFTGEPRSATVLAVQKSALLCLKKYELLTLIGKEPEFGVTIMSKIIKILSDRITANNIRIQEFQSYLISQEEQKETRLMAKKIVEEEKKWDNNK